MQKLHKIISLLFIIFALSLNNSHASNKQSKLNFWNTQQKGANIFNQDVILDDIKAAKKYNIKFIRLSPDKFISSQRDFLIGDADNYQGLIKEDLQKLKNIFDMCRAENMPVIITMLSLPGSRWKQNNNGQDDLRIWQDKKFQAQAAAFWRDLANELKNYSIIVGYNILNEPHPERIFYPKAINISSVKQDEVQIMLHNFYALIIKNIRLVDNDTPIILDSSSYGDAQTFNQFKAHKDQNIIYSFHIYEPYEYTNYKINKGNNIYPGEINGKLWNKEELTKYMSLVSKFQKTYNISNNRILVGEFGGHRMTPGLDKYFQDLISIFNENKWHFAFYAFREDTWDGMDYELGSEKLSWSHWKAIEDGKKPNLERKNSHPAFLVIKNDFIG